MEYPNLKPGEVSTGTTIVAVCYKDGVVVGADGRVSVGTYISNRSSSKVTPICDNVYVLRSGSAPDAQLTTDYVRHMVDQLIAEEGQLPTVELVANIVSNISYNNKQLSNYLLCAGWDERNGGQVFGLCAGGSMSKERWTIDGSGSTYIWGYCDAEFKDDMTQAEAEAMVVEALALAMARDSSSGGCIRTVTISREGAVEKYIRGDQVPLFHEEILPPGRGMIVD